MADGGDEERIEQALTGQQAQLDAAFQVVRQVAPSVVGLTEADASRVARENGCSLRVVVWEGTNLAVTADYMLRRIDVSVAGGSVAECLLSPPPNLPQMHRQNP